MADAQQVVPYFGDDVVLKRVGHFVDVAGKHQILPHNQAQLVARVQKPVLGVIAAAPYADRVKMAGGAVGQQLARAFRRGAPDQVIFRDVVRAHGEQLVSVHLQAELLAEFVPVAGEHEGAQADAPGGLVLHLALPVQAGDGQRVQRVFPPAVGLPQARLVNRNFQRAAAVGIGGFRAVRVGQGNAQGGGEIAVGLGVYRQGNTACFVALQNLNSFDPKPVVPFQSAGPPDARIRQLRAPVPPEHVMRLAQEAGAMYRAGTVVGYVRVSLRGFLDKAVGGAQQHGQRIAAFPQQGFHIHTPGAVHVIGMQHGLPVYRYVGQCIQPPKNQINPPMGQERRGYVEGAFVSVIPIHHPQGFIFVFPPEGVLDQSGGQQIAQHRTWHPGGNVAVACRFRKGPIAA